MSHLPGRNCASIEIEPHGVVARRENGILNGYWLLVVARWDGFNWRSEQLGACSGDVLWVYYVAGNMRTPGVEVFVPEVRFDVLRWRLDVDLGWKGLVRRLAADISPVPRPPAAL